MQVSLACWGGAYPQGTFADLLSNAETAWVTPTVDRPLPPLPAAVLAVLDLHQPVWTALRNRASPLSGPQQAMGQALAADGASQDGFGFAMNTTGTDAFAQYPPIGDQYSAPMWAIQPLMGNAQNWYDLPDGFFGFNSTE